LILLFLSVAAEEVLFSVQLARPEGQAVAQRVQVQEATLPVVEPPTKVFLVAQVLSAALSLQGLAVVVVGLDK
jgi:hypothetical protein